MVDGQRVALVIPGRNCARTLEACLKAVTPLIDVTPLSEIIYVDDASTDASLAIARRYSVCTLSTAAQRGPGGPGAARNVGWKAASSPLIWFIDSDCVAEADALGLLLAHLSDSRVGGVGGSYGNMERESLLACLIHEEIIERHRRMPPRVTFLGSFNVLYRRDVLERVSGFDERFLKAQDAELCWRVLDAGYELAFEPRSRVKHFHPVRLSPYLRTQREQGYWRMHLYRQHARRARGDSYSGLVDHLQPPVGLLLLVTSPFLLVSPWRWIPLGLLVLLVLLQVPMTLRLLLRTGRPSSFLYAGMGAVRAVWRGVGMVEGVWSSLRRKVTPA